MPSSIVSFLSMCSEQCIRFFGTGGFMVKKVHGCSSPSHNTRARHQALCFVVPARHIAALDARRQWVPRLALNIL